MYGWNSLPTAPPNSYSWHGNGYGWMLDPNEWQSPKSDGELIEVVEEAPLAAKHVKKQEAFDGSRRKSVPGSQNFEKLRDECLESGVLFEDPEFPPTDSSLFFSQRPDRHYQWLRPSEISDNPQFFVEGFSRFDVEQGELGDCWLLAAIVNLTLNRKIFFKIVPDNQDFDNKYAGIFHFRFWQYGKWVEVVIDDRLPTYRGELVFLRSPERNEFWSALLEKAYAKLHGSYEALKGGSQCEAMEDFTGGVTEMYELKDSPPNLFQILLKAYERNSMMGASIEPDPNVLEAETSEGLIRGHAYSITKVQKVDISTPNQHGLIPLIRLRNPWGNEAEWNGPWSDGSSEWQFIPQHEKEKLGLVFDRDGEFWMSYRDFQRYFDRLEICNLTPDSLTVEDLQLGKKKWEMSVFEGEWIRGVTAGGCRNYLETFSHNPQYRIELTEIDENDDENKCTVIIALMQKNRRSLRNRGEDCLTIGFLVYYLPYPEHAPKPLDKNFFKYNKSIAGSPAFINLREVSCRFKLPRGTYCIVPSTFDPNEEAEFLLRVFSENKNNMMENDEDIGTCNLDERVTPDPDNDVPSTPTAPQPTDKVYEFFLRLAGDDREVDWMELKQILDYAFRFELESTSKTHYTDSEARPSGVEVGGDQQGCGDLLISLVTAICNVFFKDTPIANTLIPDQQQAGPLMSQTAQFDETHNRGFSPDLCRTMVAMMDKDGTGKLGYVEFKTLWLDIRNWKNAFKLYDKNQSGYLSAFELRQALHSAGFKLNNHLLGALVQRFASREGYVAFHEFIMCAVKLKMMCDDTKEYQRFMNESSQMAYATYSNFGAPPPNAFMGPQQQPYGPYSGMIPSQPSPYSTYATPPTGIPQPYNTYATPPPPGGMPQPYGMPQPFMPQPPYR